MSIMIESTIEQRLFSTDAIVRTVINCSKQNLRSATVGLVNIWPMLKTFGAVEIDDWDNLIFKGRLIVTTIVSGGVVISCRDRDWCLAFNRSSDENDEVLADFLNYVSSM